MLRTKVCFASFLCLFLAATGCASHYTLPGHVQTRTIEFRADKKINSDQLLPIDIIYITYLHRLREVTSIGPENWFDSAARQEWAHKESIGVNGGKTVTVELDERLLKETTVLVVFAGFKDVIDPAPQQVIIDQHGKQDEVIRVHARSLEPLNPALKSLY